MTARAAHWLRITALLGALALVAACESGGGGGDDTAENSEATCRDGVDNDGDGRKDCLDPECRDLYFCAPGYDAGGGGSDGGGLVGDVGGGGSDAAAPTDAAEDGSEPPADACTPQCANKQCGDNGCGGVCGTCPNGQACNAEFQCVDCDPNCVGKQCGDDGCGGSCGDCLEGRACQAGVCVVCNPNCGDRECGPQPNDCGGTCGECTGDEFCSPDYECVDCLPECEGKQCGSDGCGGSCGACPGDLLCDDHTFQCYEQCLPNCAGRGCGPDGCGGTCGECDAGLVCNTANGQCQTECRPYCQTRECGTDGCGGICPPDDCQFPEMCDPVTGRCVDRCIRDCGGKECGDDGCGSRCGYCPTGQGCNAQGQCYPLPYNCPATLQCVRSCVDDDETCVAACRANAQAGSGSLYDSLKVCMESNCPGTPDHQLMTCLSTNCGPQLQSCNLDFLCGDPGTDSCANVSSCMGSCTDGACVNNCLCRASEPAYQPALAYAQCLIQNCPSFDGACMGGGMMGACAMQWIGCFGM